VVTDETAATMAVQVEVVETRRGIATEIGIEIGKGTEGAKKTDTE